MGVGFPFIRAMLATALLVATASCATLESRTREALNAPGIEGTRWGLVVTTMDGRELVAIRPDERFLPASNTKLFTVAAAFHRIPNVEQPDPARGTSVWIEPRADGPPDIILVGGGDAMLIDAADCQRDCLSSLADTVVANRITRVNDVVGDDRLFPDQPWGQGWSWEDVITRSGAAASALTVNSNEVALVVRPGSTVGSPADVAWRESDVLGGQYFYDLKNDAMTVETGEGVAEQLFIERLQDSSRVRVFGRVAIGAAPRTLPVSVADPAIAAAWRFRHLLAQRGVVMEGATRAAHRPVGPADDPRLRKGAPVPSQRRNGMEVARLLPPPLIEDMRFLMKQSQNQHAELLLRQLGLLEGGGSADDGLAIVEAMMDEIGADRSAWDLSDGSGMSVYNRVTPHTVTKLLRWTAQQPWGEQFRATLPIGGVDGTLSRRFKGTPLEGRIFAKTGTLRGTNALSGFMLTKGGEMLVFSAYANDRPQEVGSATTVLDQALVAIAESR